MPLRRNTVLGQEECLAVRGCWSVARAGLLSTLNMRRRGDHEILLTNDLVDNHAAFAVVEAAGTAVSIGASYLFIVPDITSSNAGLRLSNRLATSAPGATTACQLRIEDALASRSSKCGNAQRVSLIIPNSMNCCGSNYGCGILPARVGLGGRRTEYSVRKGARRSSGTVSLQSPFRLSHFYTDSYYSSRRWFRESPSALRID